MNSNGETLLKTAIDHSGESLAALAQKIACFEPDTEKVSVCIELHNGSMLAWMLDRGYTVYGINPKSAERSRDRYRCSGSKDDNIDAFVLADIIRTNTGYFRPIRRESERTRELRAWVRMRAGKVHETTATYQRLRAILDEWCPGLSILCNDLNNMWQRDLLMDFPLHKDLCSAHGNRINTFAKKHRLQKATRKRIQETKEQLPLPIPEGLLDALRMEIRLLIESIENLAKTISKIEAKLDQLIDSHPDSVIFKSLPVSGTATVAAFLSAFGQNRENAPHWRELSARWGAAPVTVKSGKSCHVKRRRACDHTMKQAFVAFAFNTAFKQGCWASEYYQHKRKNGAGHHTTLRCISQKWIKIIYCLWKNRILYAEHVHQNNRLLQGEHAA